MKSVAHIKKTFFRRRLIRFVLKNQNLSHFLSRHCLRAYLAIFYENWTNQRMNYRNPQDLNQALVKLSYKNSKDEKMRRLIPICVDKYKVRDFIKEKGYGDTLNELYGVYENVEDIDFNALPDQFVMKMNNASGRNYVCTDKTKCNWDEVKASFAEWQNDTEFGWQTGEWQYALIKPCIVIEKYLKDFGDVSLVDYKIQCVKGKAMDFFVCYNRENNVDDKSFTGEVCYDCYDLNWNRTDDILPKWHKNRQLIPRPVNFEKMIQMAEACTKDFTYCRFDLYEINGRIVFGEMTFTPHGNVLDFYSDEYLVRNRDVL